MGVKKYFRHSEAVTNTLRWQRLRFLALRRDGFACVECDARHKLQVDHIKPVRTHPELSWELSNLQTLCERCHSRKTRIECGLRPYAYKRGAWCDAVNEITETNRRKPCWTL